jgi:dTDP-4-amino-4,6-dideoxygalactose transaminase
MSISIPFYSLAYQHHQIRQELEKALIEVVDSGWYVLGERVARFEKEYADYIGVKHCIGVGNGLDALKISLRALDIGLGDEVIVPANTYIATLLAVTSVGATPVLVEPDVHTFNIDPDKIEDKITKRTKAIIPVHLYGLSCKMDAIMSLASSYNLYVVEDNAQATGSIFQGQKTGSFGHLNAHSFYPTKNLGALGDGGAITTNDDELAHKVRLFRNYGSSIKYENEVLGYNSRLDEIQAAVLSIKLRFLDQWILEKRQLTDHYNLLLGKTEHLEVTNLVGFSKEQHSHHLYVIKSKQRDALACYLKEHGIHTLIHYPIPVYRQQAYASVFDANAYPITNHLTDQLLSLPLFPGMKAEQVEEVVFNIQRFYN